MVDNTGVTDPGRTGLLTLTSGGGAGRLERGFEGKLKRACEPQKPWTEADDAAISSWATLGAPKGGRLAVTSCV